MFGPATPAEVHAAQIITGAAMALFLVVGLVPALRPHVMTIRAVVLAAYLAGCAVFIGFVLLR